MKGFIPNEYKRKLPIAVYLVSSSSQTNSYTDIKKLPQSPPV